MAKNTTQGSVSKAYGKAPSPRAITKPSTVILAGDVHGTATHLVMRMRNMTRHHREDLWAVLMDEAANFIEETN